jgi:hypothetical protein
MKVSMYGEEDTWHIYDSHIPIMVKALKVGTRICFSNEEWTSGDKYSGIYFRCRQYIGDNDVVNTIVTNDERRRLIRLFYRMDRGHFFM